MDVEAISAALAPPQLAPPIARILGLRVEAVEQALRLLAAGAQPAFVARYRSERVHGLTIRDLERIQARAAAAAGFEFRRQELLAQQQRRPGDDTALTHAELAEHAVDLDDVRSLLKRRKRGPGAKARAAGLGALAAALWDHGSRLPRPPALARAAPPDESEPSEDQPEQVASPEVAEPAANPPSPETSDMLFDPEAAAANFVSEEFGSAQAALAGARTICAEHMAECPPLRKALRGLILEHGKLHSEVVPERKDKAARYAKFSGKSEPCKTIAATSVLALHRAEREGLLVVELDVDPDAVTQTMHEVLGIVVESPAGSQLSSAAQEAWAHGLGKAVAQGVRKLVKEWADREAISDYAEVLRPLLLAPALGPKPVIGIDPGLQNGCRVVVVGADGSVVAEDTLFPLQPKLQVPQAKARIAELVAEHGVAAIVVLGGASGREVERLCRQLVREDAGLGEVAVIAVDSDASALFAGSRVGKEELPKADAATRRAVSAARRVQDPLRELVKIDARKLGLGQYQHEVDQEELRTSLEQVVTSAVGEIGVDVNRAPADLLARVAGLSHALSKALVTLREAAGPLRSRSDLLDIPGMAGKAFEQAAGFLRVEGSEHPLDATMIHPERYGQVTEMARELGVTVADLLGNAELVDRLAAEVGEKHLGKPGVSGEPLGKASLAFILEQLRQPGRDPRPPFETVEFHPDLAAFEDLQVGMEIEGIVTHLAPFGAFVDVGIAQEALVHVSELSHTFVSNPLDAVHVGQRVKGRVIEISPERKRFSLSLKALMARPEGKRSSRPEAGPSKKRRKPAEGGAPKGKPGKPRDKEREREPGRDRAKPQDRVLGFRLDLSDLANRLNKG